jgi:hypothetical protein
MVTNNERQVTAAAIGSGLLPHLRQLDGGGGSSMGSAQSSGSHRQQGHGKT